MDNKEDIILKAKTYLELVKASDFPMQIEKAYLFGSFAKGNPHEYSDIDIAFIVKQWEGDYFDVVPPMWLLCSKVDSRIEPHIVVPEDDYADFLPEIERTGIVLS
ncbi:MAG: nucleotidyltransferase domain-containing protein [Chitinispirillales bacterium]|jgi:predicted nucleotidyltransferase|nr:nucleotidyltransferase domain-containing protein [Chitinispirillales bacterium]